jgi:hypothetical protein
MGKELAIKTKRRLEKPKHIYFTVIERPFNRGFELKWIKEATGQGS